MLPRTVHDDADEPDDLAPSFARGTAVGRFIVLELLGMGGMGMVVAAYDPDLDRKVAIKLLRGDVRHRTGVLLAEARAMAQLNHPNVVRVHEVGQLGERGYVVMEHVAGTTLRGWLEAAPRSWEEILQVHRAAARGLAAAHRAGIVHRDVKPDNILVGEDGRARVSDFGLVGTASGRAGTAGYMAPEQVAGGPVDARADQYGFCVTLWESLTGVTPESLPVHGAPEWLLRVLRRGLAREPEARWPSMDALIAALRPPIRRRLVTLAGAALAAGLAASLLGARHDEPACELGAAWDETRQQAVHDAVSTLRLPAGEPIWRELDGALGEYGRRWSEVCRVTRGTTACLDHHRDVLDTLTRVWGDGLRTGELERVRDAVAGLPSLAPCIDGAPRTPEAPGVREARRRVARLEALTLAGRLAEAELAARMAWQAVGDRWLPVRAELELAEGTLLVERRSLAAESRLRSAARDGAAARDQRLVVRAYLELVRHRIEQGDPAGARFTGELAELELRRAGNDPELRARLDALRSRLP